MKKLYFLDEQEKNRILGLHTEATKNQYLGNKKLLMEGIPKIPPLWKIFNSTIFLSGGKKWGDQLATFLKTNDNVSVDFAAKLDEAFKAFDDELKNKLAQWMKDPNNPNRNPNYKITEFDGIVDYLFRDGDRLYFQDAAGNEFNLNKIFEGLSNVGSEINSKELDEFIGGIPNNIISSGKRHTDNFSLRTSLRTYLKSLKPGFVANYTKGLKQSFIRKPIRTAFGVSATALATLYGLSALWSNILLNIRQGRGTDRKEISEWLEDTINKSCSAVTSTEWTDNVYSEQPSKNPLAVAQTIHAAGISWFSSYLDTGTWNSTIGNELRGLKNMTNFCMVVRAFDKRFKGMEGSELFSDRPYNYAIVQYLDYEFTGRGPDDVVGYRTHVESVVNDLMNQSNADLNKSIKKEEAKVNDLNKDAARTDSGERTDCTKEQTWECLVKNRPQFKSYLCVKSAYDSSPLKIGDNPQNDTKRIINTPENYTYAVRIGNEAYLVPDKGDFGLYLLGSNTSYYRYKCEGSIIKIDKNQKYEWGTDKPIP